MSTEKPTISNGESNAQYYESPYMRKEKKFNFWRGLYNKDKNYILGKSPTQWGKLLVFYSCFYIVLAALCAICMKGLLSTIDEVEPTYKLKESRIGDNPGLAIRPISNNVTAGSLIWYDVTDKYTIQPWVKLLDKFLEPYVDKSVTVDQGKNQVQCDFDNPPADGRVCAFDVKSFGVCNSANNYSYHNGSPCIFLKLNKIFDWVPEYYDDVNNLPADMPTDLVEHIKKIPEKERKQVWISCNAENSADRETIGPIKYIGSRGFPGYFYPYKNARGYLNPLVVVQIERPALSNIINIECRAWAKNVIYNRSARDRQGSIHFELMIDNKYNA